MIRVALAVFLTVALLAAVMPALDEGRATRTAIHLDGVTDRIERAVHGLRAHEDPTPPGVVGARRIVTVRLPTPSWTAVGATLRIDGAHDRIGYRLDGRRPHRTTIRGVDLRTPDGPLVVGSPGRHRLVVSLVRADGVGVVVGRG
ncbi:MAG: ABC transporter [Haloplanus sp.]